MTIINPNSIAGITSVTAQAGVMNFYKSDGTLAGLQLNGVNFNTTAGVSTFNDVYVGGTITYEDVKNVDSVGIVTARDHVKLVTNNKKITFGSGSNLEIYSTGTDGVVNAASGDIKIQKGGSGLLTFKSTGSHFLADVLIADSIIHDGDTDTKIRFPSNDNISMEIAGTERFDLTSTTLSIHGNIRASDYVAHRTVDSLGVKFYNAGAGNNNTHVGLGAEDNGTSGGINHKTFQVFRQGSSVNRVNIDASGNLNVVTGKLQINDTIEHIGDSNTKIRFPAADTFTIETAGSERVRVDSSGNFGINTNNPTAELDVERATGTVEVMLQSRDSSDCFVSFGDNGDSDIGQIRYAHSDNSMRFTTNTGERLRIASDGKIGITESSPACYGIHASQASQSVYYRADSGSVDSIYGSATALGYAIAGTTSNHPFVLYANNAERLRIASDGKILMGVAANNGPAAPLHIYGGSNTTPIIAFTRNTTHDDWQGAGIGLHDEGGSYKGALTFYTHGSSGTKNDSVIERLRILSGGEVCIGRTSAVVADSKLNIQCDATKPAIAIQCGHTNTDTDLITAWNSGGKNIVNITAETDNSPYLKFEILSGNSPVERFRVNHLGNVSIGGGTAPNRLEIIDDHQGFPSDSAQPHASLLIKHGTSGSNRRWVGIGASLTGAWLQSSSPGGSGLSAPFWINKGGGDVTLGNDRLKVTSSGDVCIGATAPVSAEKLYVLNGSAISGRSIDPLTAVLFESAECRLQLQSDNTGSNASTLILSNDDKHWMVQHRASSKSNNFQIGYYDGTAGDLSNLSSYALQIKTNGVAQFSTTGSFDTYTTADNAYQFRHDFTNVAGVWISNTNSSHTKELLRLDSARSGSSSFYLATFTTGNLGDDQFLFRGDGSAYQDGGTTWSTPADYAEMFEWDDGNPNNEDRRGISVVLVGDKIRAATSSDDTSKIIGVISGNPAVTGDGGYTKWHLKYLLDDYNNYILDGNGERQLNPDYDSTKTYVPREDRKEWSAVGMLGKLRVKVNQPVGSSWIKLKNISASIEQWLVR